MNNQPAPQSEKKPSLVSYQQRVHRRREVIKSIKAKADMNRTPAEKFADWMTNFFGTSAFLWFNIAWFVVWIFWNTRILPGVTPFDPFPFSMLTTVVSLEAIVLAIIVLISQNRAARISELREEIDIQINLIAETEITKIMKLMTLLLEKNGVDLAADPELKNMLENTNLEKIEQELAKQM